MSTIKTDNQSARPPIIAIMGHIDHGKSTLLDYIRKSNVVAREAGGITQHISAYEVVHRDQKGQDKKITFLDTPGHEAFSKMRERGAAVADIAVLIVSAEEGVKAQTLEAYKSIIESKTPFIVAINKIDRPNANIDRVKQELADGGVYVEGWGGDIPCVPISAKSGQGVPDLLDMMLLVAEVEDLKGDNTQGATGYVLEANLDPRIGVTTTLIIKNGTLHTGDCLTIGTEAAKIKKIENFLGETITQASFSSPIRVFGFSTLPAVGETFHTYADKKAAEAGLIEQQKSRPKAISADSSTTTETTETQVEIPLVIKADVAGTLEALVKEVTKQSNDRVVIKIVYTGVGPLTESDIKMLGSSNQGIALGFHVKTEKGATDLAERFGMKIISFDIIYKLSEWLEAEMIARQPKEKVEETIGRAKILKVFSQNKDKQIIGGQVTTGKISRGKEVKILRRETEVGRGKITDLQEQKIKTGLVEEGAQFGAEVDSKLLIAPGDFLEVFEIVIK